MHPTPMRRFMIVAQILFILFIVNFALAAPVTERECVKVRANVGVTEGRTAVSRREVGYDPREKGSTNAPRSGSDSSVPSTVSSSPPSMSSSEFQRLMDTYAINHSPLAGTSSSGAPEGSNTAPLSPGSPTELESTADSRPPRPPPQSFFGQPGHPAVASSSGHQPTPPQSPGPNPDVHPAPSQEPLPGEFREGLLPSGRPAVGSSSGHQPTPPQSPGPNPDVHPAQSQEPLPDGSREGLLPSGRPAVGSSPGRQPTTPQSPGPNPDVHPAQSPEPLPKELLGDLMKGKIKPRVPVL